MKNELYRLEVDVKSPLSQPDSRLNRCPFPAPWTQSGVGGCYVPSIGSFRVHYITSLGSIQLNRLVQLFLLEVFQRAGRICGQLVSPVKTQTCKCMQIALLIRGSSPRELSGSPVGYGFSYC